MNDGFRLFPREASWGAASVDHLVLFVLGVCLFFTILIMAGVIGFALRYRRRDPTERPPKISGHWALEITWMAIPLAIMLVMFFWGARVFVVAKTPPPDAMEIFVVGKQWMWEVQHAEGRREIDSLHVPLGVAVQLTLTSQDVVHDFSVPAFRMKQDVVPGMYTHEWFTANRLGEYHLFCDQYCGAKHAEMIGTVFVQTPQDYARWLAGAPGGATLATQGEKLFTSYGCMSCHGQYGPTLAGLYGHAVDVIDDTGARRTVVADETYLRESILYPEKKLVVGYPNRMPSFKSTLSEEQLLDLIQYIKSLGGGAAPTPYVGPPAGAATQPSDFEPRITNPPFSNYRTNQ